MGCSSPRPELAVYSAILDQSCRPFIIFFFLSFQRDSQDGPWWLKSLWHHHEWARRWGRWRLQFLAGEMLFLVLLLPLCILISDSLLSLSTYCPLSNGREKRKPTTSWPFFAHDVLKFVKKTARPACSSSVCSCSVAHNTVGRSMGLRATIELVKMRWPPSCSTQ